MSLLEELIKSKWLKTPRIIDAFREIKRIDFLPKDLKSLAEANVALPIEYSQTISQPLVVAFMLEELCPKEGEKVLDIGSGSGYTTALLAQIVGNKGKVIGMEVVPELLEFGKKNVLKYNFIKEGRVEMILRNGSEGFKEKAPFDRILVSATAEKFFPAWKEQLKTEGRIVFPMKSSIWRYVKKSENEFEDQEYPGFVFVPLIQK